MADTVSETATNLARTTITEPENPLLQCADGEGATKHAHVDADTPAANIVATTTNATNTDAITTRAIAQGERFTSSLEELIKERERERAQESEQATERMRQESKWRHWAESTRRPYELPSTIRCVFCLAHRYPLPAVWFPFLIASLVPHRWSCSLVEPEGEPA